MLTNHVAQNWTDEMFKFMRKDPFSPNCMLLIIPREKNSQQSDPGTPCCPSVLVKCAIGPNLQAFLHITLANRLALGSEIALWIMCMETCQIWSGLHMWGLDKRMATVSKYRVLTQGEFRLTNCYTMCSLLFCYKAHWRNRK